MYRFGKPTRAGYTLMYVFIVLFWGSSTYFWNNYREFDVLPQRATWGHIIREQTDPNDQVVGNIDRSAYQRVGFEPIIAYYAQRETNWGVLPGAVVAGDVAADFYVLCPQGDSIESAEPINIPPALEAQAVAVQAVEACWFIDLKP